MPLFAIHRTLDPKATPHERELIVARSIGFVDTPMRPTWRRTFAVQTETRFETWCLYEGRNAEQLVSWNHECAVPFDEVRPVEQWRRDVELTTGEGNTFFWLVGRLEPGREPEEFNPLLRESQPIDGVRLIRVYWDAARHDLQSLVSGPSDDAVARFAAAVGLPHDQVNAVDQILPTDFTAFYENVGFAPYNGDD